MRTGIIINSFLAFLIYASPMMAEQRIKLQQARSATSASTLTHVRQMQGRLDQAAKRAFIASQPVRSKISARQSERLKAIGRELARNPRSKSALRKWKNLIRSMKPVSGDVGALVQWVMRESYLQQLADLRMHAEKVKYLNSQKSKLRNEMKRLRNSRNTKLIRTKRSKLEDELNSVGEDAQLANLNLQDSLQKMSRVMQILSNIAKTMHDTAKNTIRKIGG